MRTDYLSGAQLALTFVPGAELSVAQGFGSLETALLLGDFTWCLCGGQRWKGQVDAGGRCLEIITLCGFEQR